MFERFTPSARRALVVSNEEAAAAGAAEIQPVHLLAAVLKEGGTIAGLLERHGLTYEFAQRAVRSATAPRFDRPDFGHAAKKALELALREALQMGSDIIDCDHLVLGIARIDDPICGPLLLEAGGAYEPLRRALLEATPDPDVGAERTAWAGPRGEAWRALLGRAVGRRLAMPPLVSPGARVVLDLSADMARTKGTSVTTEHLLLAALNPDTSSGKVLAAAGLDYARIKQLFDEIDTPTLDDATAGAIAASPEPNPPQPPLCMTVGDVTISINDPNLARRVLDGDTDAASHLRQAIDAARRLGDGEEPPAAAEG